MNKIIFPMSIRMGIKFYQEQPQVDAPFYVNFTSGEKQKKSD